MSKSLILKIAFGIFIIAIGSYLILTFFNHNNSVQVDNSVFNIVLDRGPCFGSCPVYTVAVDNSGTVSLRQSGQADQTYNIGSANAKQLYLQALNINFFSLDDKYEDLTITDLPSTTITVQTASQTKSIYIYGVQNVITDALNQFATQIDKITQVSTHLTQVQIH